MRDVRAGPLHDSLLFVDYYRPRVIKVLPWIEGGEMTAAFRTPLLKGAVNPADGQVYFVGMQIWGSTAERLEGLCRLRALTDDDGLPVRARVFREGVYLEFRDEASLQPDDYRLRGWNYHRSAEYGSGQFRTDGEPGVETWPVARVVRAGNGHGVLLVVPDARPLMQWELSYVDGAREWRELYFSQSVTPSLPRERLGFVDLDLSVTALASSEVETPSTAPAASLQRGRELATRFGCVGCHSLDGSTEGKSGPTWRGLFGSLRRLQDGREVVADEVYLHRAILDPAEDVVEGYYPGEGGMPSYRGIFTYEDLESLTLYLRSLE